MSQIIESVNTILISLGIKGRRAAESPAYWGPAGHGRVLRWPFNPHFSRLLLLRLVLLDSACVGLEIGLDRVSNPAAAPISAFALAEPSIPAPRYEPT